MQLKFADDNLLIEGEKVKLTVVPKGATLKNPADIVLSFDALKADGFVISEPGEYEVKDVFIYALPLAGKNVELFSINLDAVTVVFIPGHIKEIPKTILDELGIDDVLVMDMSGLTTDLSDHLSLSEDFDPTMLIPVRADTEMLTKIASELGVQLPERVNKLKISSSDFESEEQSLQLVVL
jgi:hypothetical protein